MILCVNLNAAIDKTIVVDTLRLGEIQRPESVKSLPGGKGCNVARALRHFGVDAVVTGWVGGTAGQFIETGLQAEGIGTDFVHTGLESRTCTSILDRSTQALTEIYEKGHPIPPDKVTEMQDHFRRIVGDYETVTLSGSLPPGAPSDFYAQLIGLAHEAAVPILLDSSGLALREGVGARPALIKPNEAEAAGLSERPMSTLSEMAEAAVNIARDYSTIVALSLGRRGAILADPRQVFHIQNPPVEAVSAVGSGDCMLAGLAYGLARGLPLPECGRIGVAAGTANSVVIGAGQFTRAGFDDVYAATQVSQIS
jgi:1-phosphofructokinase family hexose kinase